MAAGYSVIIVSLLLFTALACDEPNDCLNRRCDSERGSPRCTEGCKDGYSGDFCKEWCCASCANKYRCLACEQYNNMKCTKCTSGYYGAQCKDACKNCKDGLCYMNGTCFEEIPTSSDSPTSISSPTTLMRITLLPSVPPKLQKPALSLQPSESENACPEGCRDSLCDNITLQCEDGCNTGYYGSNCNQTCPPDCVECGDPESGCGTRCLHCTGGRCTDTGECVLACPDGRCTGKLGHLENFWNKLKNDGVLLPVLVGGSFILLIVTGVIFYRCRRKTTIVQTQNSDTSETHEVARHDTYDTIADEDVVSKVEDQRHFKERPMLPDSQRRPMLPDSQRRPMLPDSQRRPMLPDSQRRPMLPVLNRRSRKSVSSWKPRISHSQRRPRIAKITNSCRSLPRIPMPQNPNISEQDGFNRCVEWFEDPNLPNERRFNPNRPSSVKARFDGERKLKCTIAPDSTMISRMHNTPNEELTENSNIIQGRMVQNISSPIDSEDPNREGTTYSYQEGDSDIIFENPSHSVSVNSTLPPITEKYTHMQVPRDPRAVCITCVDSGMYQQEPGAAPNVNSDETNDFSESASPTKVSNTRWDPHRMPPTSVSQWKPRISHSQRRPEIADFQRSKITNSCRSLPRIPMPQHHDTFGQGGFDRYVDESGYEKPQQELGKYHHTHQTASDMSPLDLSLHRPNRHIPD